MFDICFISDVPEEREEGRRVLRGRTLLDEHYEEFEATLGLWARQDYEQHWRQAAALLVAGATRSAFLTSAFQFRWRMWREGPPTSTAVVVQEELLVAEEDGGAPFDPATPLGGLGPRAVPAPGEPAPSEWWLRVEDFHDFLQRRAPRH